jgi:uncharacterized protein
VNRSFGMNIGLLLVLSLAVLSAACMKDPDKEFSDGMDAYGREQYELAFKKWKPLAEDGNVAAQTNIGVMYYQGVGVTQDYKEAVKWYKMAAAQGYAEAEYNLGVTFAEGKGSRQDYREAKVWYEAAAKQGYSAAQLMLAEMYYRGQGIAADYDQARNWYRQAAIGGSPAAAYITGMMYLNGEGGNKDVVQAYRWLTVAANIAGSTAKQNALRGLEMLAEKMSTAQIAEAKKQAADTLASKDSAKN